MSMIFYPWSGDHLGDLTYPTVFPSLLVRAERLGKRTISKTQTVSKKNG